MKQLIKLGFAAILAIAALTAAASPAVASFTCNTGAGTRCTATLSAGRTTFDVARLAVIECDTSTISGTLVNGQASISTLGRYVDFKGNCSLSVLGSTVCTAVAVSVDPNDATWTVTLASSTPAATNSWDTNITIGNVTIVTANCRDPSFAGSITVASGQQLRGCARYTQSNGVVTVRCGGIRITSAGGLRTLGTPNSTFTGSYTATVDGTAGISPTVS